MTGPNAKPIPINIGTLLNRNEHFRVRESVDFDSSKEHTSIIAALTSPILMDKKTVAASLRALAADDAKRPKAARLRDVYDDVEATLAAGVPQFEVVATLKQQGLDMTLATFQTTLKRIRAKQRPDGLPPRHIPTAPAPSSAPAHASREPGPPPIEPSHKPGDLDSIISKAPDLTALSKLSRKNRKS